MLKSMFGVVVVVVVVDVVCGGGDVDDVDVDEIVEWLLLVLLFLRRKISWIMSK